jgi:ubiquitin-protein ligase
MQFTCKMFHPNIYDDGRVCISILHPPGTVAFRFPYALSARGPLAHDHPSRTHLLLTRCISSTIIDAEKGVSNDIDRVVWSRAVCAGDDPMGYEKASERWSPVQSIEKILLSVVSMLAESVAYGRCGHAALHCMVALSTAN